MNIKSAIFSVLNQDGKIAGTGFLVSQNLGITCAHVITAANSYERNAVQIRFSDQLEEINALVVPELWRDVDQGDIAFLKFDHLPKAATPLTLRPAVDSKPGNPFFSFGYATAADIQGIIARGTIDGYLEQHQLLQLQAPQANHGISGAPVVDEKRGAVVGMITKGHTELGRNELTTFATPTEVIWQICPQLKPVISPLPYRHSIIEGINLLPYDYGQRIQNFLTEYLGTNQHPIPFGGRDDALHVLNDWLAGTTPYLLLAAPAGRGKSALLVRWLESLKKRENLKVVFIPVSIRFRTNLASIVFASMAARLAFVHGDDVPTSPETSTEVYRGLVSSYLEKPLQDGSTLLVVIDGADEAGDWDAGTNLVSTAPPNKVRVIVSARYLAGDMDAQPWLRRLGWQRRGLAYAPVLEPLTQDGVAQVLKSMGFPLDELSQRVDIVAELYRLSKGDPLLINLYVTDLWSRGQKAARLIPEDLALIEPGYEGYFARWWDDQKVLWGKDWHVRIREVQDILNLLSGALGPLLHDDILVLNDNLSSLELESILDIIRRFIIGDGEKQGYTFSHPKLGEYFWDRLSKGEHHKIEDKLIQWGKSMVSAMIEENLKPSDVPRYVIQYYRAHLEKAEVPVEQYLSLIEHPHWQRAWFAFEGAYGGYLQDVQRVWEKCKSLDEESIKVYGKANHLSKQIRCALIEASLHSLAGNIPVDLIPSLLRDGIWTLPQIWAFIRQIPDPEQQAEATLVLMQQLTDEQLKEAQEAAESFKMERVRVRILSTLAQRLPAEELPKILKAAQSVGDEWDRVSVLCALVPRLPTSLLVKIIETAKTIGDRWTHARLLIAVARRIPEIREKALQAAKLVENEWILADLLDEIAEYLTEAQITDLLNMAQSIDNDMARARVLSCLVARRSDIAEEVLTAARAITEESERTNVLIALAKRLPELKLGKVLEVGQEIRDEALRAKVLCVLADRLPEAELDQVIKASQVILVETRIADVFSILAYRLPEEQLKQLIEVVRAFVKSETRARVLGVLAHRAHFLREEALKAARAIEDERQRAQVLSSLAKLLPGVTKEALHEAQLILDKRNQIRLLSALARYLPDTQLARVIDLIHALRDELAYTTKDIDITNGISRAIPALEDDSDSLHILVILAQRIPPSQLPQLLDMTRRIRDEWLDANVLSVSAQRLPEPELNQVLEAAKSIRNNEGRLQVLGALALRLPQLGEAVLRETQTIREGQLKSDILVALAQHLPEAQLGKVLEAVHTLHDEEAKAKVLGALALRLPQLGEEVLRETQTIREEQLKSDVLVALAQHLPEAQLGKVLAAAVHTLHNEGARIKVLGALVPRLPQLGEEVLKMFEGGVHFGIRGERVVTALAQYLPQAELLRLLKIVRHKGLDYEEMLMVLVERMPESQLGAVLEAVNDFSPRTRVLTALAMRLPEAIQEVINEMMGIHNRDNYIRAVTDFVSQMPRIGLERLLKIARGLSDQTRRADILSALVSRLPYLGEEALQASQGIRFDMDRGRVLRVLAQSSPKENLGRIVEAIEFIRDEKSRAWALGGLLQPIMELSIADRYRQTEKLIS